MRECDAVAASVVQRDPTGKDPASPNFAAAEGIKKAASAAIPITAEPAFGFQVCG
jgi:hypothetical protein